MDKTLNKTNLRLIAGVSGLAALLLLTAATCFLWPVAFNAVSKAALRYPYGLRLWRYSGFAILSFAVCAWALVMKGTAERNE